MNKEIKVYTELDSWFDYRKGLIMGLLADNSLPLEQRLTNAHTKWEQHIKKQYEDRRFDIYHYPSANINADDFKRAYDQRNINSFIYYMPSNLGSLLLKTIMETEYEYEQLTNIKSFSITVNTFPYVLDEEQQKELINSLQGRFKGRHPITLIHKDVTKATPSFYRTFNYVYKYDILLNDYKSFMEALPKEPIPETVFFVPDVLLKPVEHITGKPHTVLEAFGLTIVNIMSIKPIPKSIYDHTN